MKMAYLGIVGGPTLSGIIEKLGPAFFNLAPYEFENEIGWEEYGELHQSVVGVRMDRHGRLYYPFSRGNYFLTDGETDKILRLSGVGLHVDAPCEAYVLYDLVRERVDIQLDDEARNERNKTKEILEEKILQTKPAKGNLVIKVSKDHCNITYIFNYKTDDAGISAEGNFLRGESETCIDDDTALRHVLEYSKDALEAAVLRWKEKYPNLTFVHIDPCVKNAGKI